MLGVPFTSPGGEISPNVNRRVNTPANDSSSSTLSSLLASPSLHPGKQIDTSHTSGDG